MEIYRALRTTTGIDKGDIVLIYNKTETLYNYRGELNRARYSYNLYHFAESKDHRFEEIDEGTFNNYLEKI